MTTSNRTISGAVCLLVLLLACGGDGADGDGSRASTSDVGAALLSSQGGSGSETEDNPERGRGPVRQDQASQSRAPTAPGSDVGRPSRQYDLAELGHTVGESGAPLRIVEFSDFACGYCRQFHVDVYPALEEEYIDTGKLEWKYVPMVLGMFGPNAEEAALAGECALEQQSFPAMRDRLFEDQPEWKRADGVTDIFRRYAEEEGLDVERWAACMASGDRMDRVAAGTQLSRQVGVRGTPTFFIVGYAPIPGALPLDLFRQVLDTVYAERTAGGNDGGP